MKIQQHEALRVPHGWSGQDKALVIQLERIFTDLYKKFGRLTREDLGEALNELLDQYAADIDNIEDTMVTAVSYNAVSGKLTVTIGGVTSDIVSVATLDGNGKIPASQLPSYVDDVEEYADTAHFPPTGESDKIYVALDTGFTYRWSGTQYIRLTTYDPATQSASGLMSAADKTKLDGIETGATKTTIYNGTDHNAPGWALDAQSGYILSQNDIKTKHGIAYIAVMHSGNWQLNSGTNAAIGDFIFVNGTLGRATAAITGGSTNIVEGTNWEKVPEGAANKLQSTKADKSAAVSSVDWDGTNKKITKTINGSTTDVVAVSSIKSALGSFTWGALAGR